MGTEHFAYLAAACGLIHPHAHRLLREVGRPTRQDRQRCEERAALVLAEAVMRRPDCPADLRDNQQQLAGALLDALRCCRMVP